MTKEKNSVKSILKLIKSGEIQNALEALRSTASPHAPLITQNQYANLARKIALKLTDLPVIKIAFLANVTLEHWVDSLKFWLLLEGFKLEPYIVPIGTWRQEVLNINSYLYKFDPDIAWFFIHQSELKFNSIVLHDKDSANASLSQSILNITKKVSLFTENSTSINIVNNIVPSVERILGNYEGSIETSTASLVQRFNSTLPESLPNGSIVFDISYIASCIGLNNWYDARLWQHSKHSFSLNVQAQVAFSAARLLSAIKGRSKKCLVLDLDNTLWGGVIGDDGIDGIKIGSNSGSIGEAYSYFQQWIKSLSERGIVLAVCSKNDLKLAQEPFNKRDEMILRLSDFASFHANWENKADNIKQVAKEINLGLDSLVFIDDNPAERELIRNTLPQVSVPELPTDPSGYIDAINEGKWFETIGITKEDSLRVTTYKHDLDREKGKNSSTDLSSYLRDLQMTVKWQEVNNDTLVRSTQLINKTNQFNMTTTRYTEAQITELNESKDHWVGCFSLSDRFGDLGIISIVILEHTKENTIIDTWVMSCRVFSRGMEYFIFDKISELVKMQGQKKLIGRFILSPKNKVIIDLYNRLGGVTINSSSEQELQWAFDLDKPAQFNKYYINEV